MTFSETLTEAVNFFVEKGYTSPEDLDFWSRRIREAMLEELPSTYNVEEKVKKSLELVLKRALSPTALRRTNGIGIDKYSIKGLKPKAHIELTKRIVASSDLIQINRNRAIEQTLQRFSGFVTSIPAGGSKAIDKSDVKEHIKKPFRSASYEERRVAIDQGHKLNSAISDIVAKENNAIAAKWRSHWKQANYDYREDHKERDEKFYAIRGSWAIDQGLMNKGDGYTDEMTQPGEEVFCRCYYVYIYNLSDLPDDMLTAKGRKALDEFKAKVK